MELHYSSFPSARKKLWNTLRVALFMVRKGSTSKRKLMMDMNLMMQRGKVLGKSLGKNLTFFHPQHSSAGTPSFGLHEYEFSCANTPNPPPIFFRGSSKQRKHSYFPCMGASAVEERPDKAPPGPLAVVLPMIDYSPQSSRCTSTALAERCSTPTPSPFSAARGSNYSLAAEEAGGDGGVGGGEVDNRAEEFIKRFYQQLHAQGQSIMN